MIFKVKKYYKMIFLSINLINELVSKEDNGDVKIQNLAC